MPEHRENGVLNPETHHETSDVDVRGILWFVVIFIAFAVVTHLVLYFLYVTFRKEFRADIQPARTAIKRITNTVGFQYAYDPRADQFAHATALMVLTPRGRVSRYLYGFEYNPRDVRLALVEASSNKIGTATDAVLLLCYHYDPVTGKYSRGAMTFVRAGGVATMAGLAGFIFIMIRRERAPR